MKANKQIHLAVLLCVSVSLWLIAPVSGQVQPVYDQGALGLGRLLKRLNTTASVMMIGAHPDDEDSALVAYLARRENADTAYLSLTRGDGGQNIIGPELFESLGVIRTEELLQARRLDGARQFFTRAFDFGFSKTLAEARAKWDEKVIVCDAVRAIRLFRPLVVISRFTGTDRDGHGQHQYAGYISPIAVKAAADPKQCTAAGEAWQVLKFYVEVGTGEKANPTLVLNAGAFDPTLGRSYFEIAMEGRSQHRSQGEGRIQYHGEQSAGLKLAESHVPAVGKETSPFDGIDTSMNGVNGIAGATEFQLAGDLKDLQNIVEGARRSFDPNNPDKLLPFLVNGSKTAEKAISSTNRAEAKFILSKKLVEFAAAVRLASGLQIDALADKETVVPGDDFFAAVKIFLAKNDSVMIKGIALEIPAGWTVSKAVEPKDNNPAFAKREIAGSAAYFKVNVPRDARVTQPYWLDDPRDGDFFRWPANENQNLPFQPSQLRAQVKVEIAGTELILDQPVQFRYADAARGEFRRDIDVVPSLSVSVEPQLLVVPLSDKPQTRKLTMSITNNSSAPMTGSAGLNIKSANEWKYGFNSRTFHLESKGDKVSIPFEVTIPAKTKPGTYNIFPNAMVGEGLSSQTMNVVAYPHIQTHRYYTRAETLVSVQDLKVAPVRIGYIMGSGDDVPDAIRQMGLSLKMLDEGELASGDLSQFDTIVVGIRASETRPDFVANNQRLLDYVRAGGNLITQYQRGAFATKNLAPYLIDTEDKQETAAGSIARVVDENAKVTILEPQHPIFNFPNKISDEDFKGWVQERNAYSLVKFAAQYTPLLESHDAGEAENKGGLVIAKVGKGNYVYCSYSFFRQLPAGVPGAYRLFANMLSLRNTKGK